MADDNKTPEEKAAAKKAAAEKTAAEKLTALEEENAALKAALADAHEAISKAEAEAPGEPTLTIGKKKYRFAHGGKYPVKKHEFKLITFELLQEDKKFAEKLVKEKFSGLVLIEPETE